MEKLKEKVPTLAVIFLSSFLGFLLVSFLFSPFLESQKKELFQKQSLLFQYRGILHKKESLKKNWETYKNSFPKTLSSEEALNLWAKELLSYASSEGLTFTQLEPLGVKKNEIRLFLSFEGDIRGLAHFLYFLLEKDPLSWVHDLRLVSEEKSSFYRYELTLGRSVL
jgi:hypothetical protein